MALRYLTAGESHGRALVGIIEGVPAGLALEAGDIDLELKRRQGGYGRGGRMKIESDSAQILSGVRWGRTLGSPIALLIENRDWQNWQQGMSADAAEEGSIEAVTRPRPGHADLPGALKYGHRDVRNVLERSSARETAMRVALGAVARKLLKELGVRAGSFVSEVGHVAYEPRAITARELHDLDEQAAGSQVRCPDPAVSDKMMRLIDAATERGDSLGGVYTVFLTGLPPGLGSHVQWDRRLDGRLAQAMMSIQAMKGVEVGSGFHAARSMGSEVMDEIASEGRGFTRRSNNAGGIEGGMTNGMPLVLRVAMKPIPTQRKPLKSVDITTRKEVEAAYERSDVCAVAAASVIGEAMGALVVADAMCEKFGGDSIAEMKRNLDAYLKSIEEL
jgi:chorismate synthase